jgi:hypothetical protein
MLLILKKEFIEYSRLRALAQSIINKEKGPEAFEEFRHTAFPWVDTQQKRDREQNIKVLQDEIKRGALSIQPLQDNTKKIRSRLKTKVVESSEPVLAANKRSTPGERKLYAKIGSIV